MLPEAARFWEAFSVEVCVVLHRSKCYSDLVLLQIFHATDSETEECALKSLKVLLATLFPDDGESLSLPQDKAIGIFNKVRDSCLLELKEADKSNAAPAAKILCQAISASGEKGH